MSTADWPIPLSDFAARQAWAKPPERRNFADIQRILGDLPLQRIFASPAPGFATERDWHRVQREGIPCQLREGFLIAQAAVTGTGRAPHLLTLADYQQQLFEIPAERLIAFPSPGTAEVADCADTKETLGVICELYDGLLVGKAMGFLEGQLAMILGALISNYLEKYPLGIVNGPDAALRLSPNQVRAPDVCFVEFARLPTTDLGEESIPSIVPNLVVEILSKSNRRGEMQRKLNDYFQAGVQLVWYIDPQKQSATLYTAVDSHETIGPEGFLRGGSVLPGFEIKLADLFAKASWKRG